MPDRQLLPVSLGISVQEAARRHVLQEATLPVIDAVMADRHNFGGVIYDDSGGVWRLRIFHTGNEEARAAVEALVPANAPVEWTLVEHSYAELDAIQSEIVRQSSNLVAAGGEGFLSSTGIDHVANKVRIGLKREALEREAELRARYGDLVYFNVEEPAKPLAP